MDDRIRKIIRKITKKGGTLSHKDKHGHLRSHKTDFARSLYDLRNAIMMLDIEGDVIKRRGIDSLECRSNRLDIFYNNLNI